MWSEKIHEDPDVYMVKVPYPWGTGRVTNVYIICGEDDCLLVDTGSPDERAWHVLEHALDELGVFEKPISVFLTHLHRDHAGLAEPLMKRNARVYVGKREHECMVRQSAPGFFDEHERATLVAEGIDGPLLEMLSHTGSYAVELLDLDPDCLVAPGDVLQAAGLEFEVVRASGHTPGHLMLFEPSSRLLFSGDHLLFDLSPSLESRFAPPNALDIYFEDLFQIGDLAPDQLLFSHGELGGDAVKRAKWLVDHHRKRMNRLVDVTRGEPGLTGVEVIKRLPWNTHGRDWDEIPFLLKSAILECGFVTLNQVLYDERVARRVDDDGLRRYEVA